MKVILATRNSGKLKEFKQLIRYLDVLGSIELVPLSEISNVPEVVENGLTSEENALIKARTIARALGQWCMADDSGLCVAVLGQCPGIKSARYAGPNATDKQNNLKLIEEMKGVPKAKRGACYRCALALSDPDGKTILTVGECAGVISIRPAGEAGFGYDPYFYVPRFKKTMAELSLEVKNQISHRSLAVKELARVISNDPRFKFGVKGK